MDATPRAMALRLEGRSLGAGWNALHLLLGARASLILGRRHRELLPPPRLQKPRPAPSTSFCILLLLLILHAEMAPDLVRDSTFGQIVNQLTRGRLFAYPEQSPGYTVPARYLARSSNDSVNFDDSLSRSHSHAATLCDWDSTTAEVAAKSHDPNEPKDHARQHCLVEFDENDSDNPK